jgi:hypothetical protein
MGVLQRGFLQSKLLCPFSNNKYLAEMKYPKKLKKKNIPEKKN